MPNIEMWGVGDLIPYERNARTHSEEQLVQLMDSISEFGFTNPVLITADGMIVAGHGRVEAARRLGMSEVPTVVVGSDWSEEQLRAYILADNQLALQAGWDNDLLALELRELSDVGFNLDLIGFANEELNALLSSIPAGQTDPDDIPVAEEFAISRPGDVWMLGKHRIICGDSTDPSVVDRLLDGEVPNLMVTDPPYGVAYDPSWRNETGIADDGSLQRLKSGKARKSIGAKAVGVVLNDDRADWSAAWELFPGDVAYVWHGSLAGPLVASSLNNSGFNLRSQIIWDKGRLIIGRGDYHWQHEPCWYAVRKGAVGHWEGDRKQTTVWSIMHQRSETGHGTQKPVECMKRPIENNSRAGEAIYEPFSGSGTTIIACEMTGRRCLAIELNPVYVDVAVKRWQQFTGRLAILEGSEKTFEEIVVERGGEAEAA